jgi:cob(I)alamin adenosyltransferase
MVAVVERGYDLVMAVNLTRIYTRLGDGGETHLGDMSRVVKTHPRIEAYGDVDELNSQLGVAIAAGGLDERIVAALARVQNDLFDVGADLAVPTSAAPTKSGDRLRVSAEQVTWLESQCDVFNAELAPLRSFLLPGGTLAAAQLHVARTVCRRAERRVLLVDDHTPQTLRYLNRLSDLLFILARTANGAEEPLWQPGLGRSGD